MKKNALLASGLMALVIMGNACGGGAKPADPAKPAGTTATTAGKPAPPKPTKADTKVAKPGEKPPPPSSPPKAIPEGKKVPVPSDWVVVYDTARGYEFSVPDGTDSEWESAGDNVDVFVAKLPKPNNVEVMVIAYEDEATEKDKILATAKSILEKLGDKDVKFSDTKEDLNEDYFLVEFTSVDPKLGPTKGKLLIGVDKNDNFLVFIYSPEGDYKGNEKTIDEIWSSFSMYSGGNSGNS